MSAGIYLHIPFCKSRCSYCDFATDVYRSNDAVERYVLALRKEIEQVRTACVSGRPVPSGSTIWPPPDGGGSDLVDTIYFRRRAPSLVTSHPLGSILNA